MHQRPHKKFKKQFFLQGCLILVAVAMFAQPDSDQQETFSQIYGAAEKEYGMDQELLNGFLFQEKNENAIGHPYLFDYFSNQGSMTYRGKFYTNLFLRYDIFDQQLLLIYPHGDEEYKLILHKEYITAFSIQQRTFIRASYQPEQAPQFYQVIGKEYPIKVLRFWKKGLSNIYTNNSDTKEYTVKIETYIHQHNSLRGFNGNRSFVKSFPPDQRTAIREYIRSNRIRVQNANDNEMQQLIEFINTTAG